MKAGAGAMAALALPAGVRAWAAGDEIVVEELAADLFLVRGAGGNVVLRRGSDGIVLVNGGLAERSGALRTALGELAGDAPVLALFNTCWHDEATGLNAPLGGAGTRIIAHRNTRGWMSLDFDSPWSGRRHTAHPAHALPNDTFRTSGGRLTVGGELSLAGERIEYGHLPQAHTDGDLYVHFLDADVLVLGEVLSPDRYPSLDYYTGGFIAGLTQAAHDMLARAENGTRLIAGRGEAQARAALERQYDMLTTVYPRMVRWKDDGMGPEDMVANGVTEEFDADWGAPEDFIRSAYWSMWGRIREFETIV